MLWDSEDRFLVEKKQVVGAGRKEETKGREGKAVRNLPMETRLGSQQWWEVGNGWVGKGREGIIRCFA
jgi:hypothetical protein